MKSTEKGFISDRWLKIGYRQRCTIFALVAAISGMVFVPHHLRPTFESLIAKGGRAAAFAHIGFYIVYYSWGRSCIDLLTDVVDLFSNQYVVKGGDIREIPPTRVKTGPYYDILTAPDVKRDWSTWQYALILWITIESTLIFVLLGISGLNVGMNSPHLNPGGWGHPDDSLYPIWYFMVISGMFSMLNRNGAGVMPLPMRWLGLPHFYPGQNIYPPWLNKLLMKNLGRT